MPVAPSGQRTLVRRHAGLKSVAQRLDDMARRATSRRAHLDSHLILQTRIKACKRLQNKSNPPRSPFAKRRCTSDLCGRRFPGGVFALRSVQPNVHARTRDVQHASNAHQRPGRTRARRPKSQARTANAPGLMSHSTAPVRTRRQHRRVASAPTADTSSPRRNTPTSPPA